MMISWPITANHHQSPPNHLENEPPITFQSPQKYTTNQLPITSKLLTQARQVTVFVRQTRTRAKSKTQWRPPNQNPSPSSHRHLEAATVTTGIWQRRKKIHAEALRRNCCFLAGLQYACKRHILTPSGLTRSVRQSAPGFLRVPALAALGINMDSLVTHVTLGM